MRWKGSDLGRAVGWRGLTRGRGGTEFGCVETKEAGADDSKALGLLLP